MTVAPVAGLGCGALVLTVLAMGRAAHARARGHAVLRRVPDRGAWGAGHPGARRSPAWLATVLADAALPVDPAQVWHAMPFVAFGVAVVGFAAGGPALAVLCVAVGAVASWAGLRSCRGRATQLLDRALPPALEAVARSLRSGGSLGHAIAEAAGATSAPLADELRKVVHDADAGVGLAAALEQFGQRQPSGAVQLAVAALALGVDTGGAQARAVDGVAATLRDRLGLEAEVRALSSQARASAVVIGIAPVAFGGLAAVTDRGTAAFLFRTPAGLLCLTGGLALDALSWFWMRQLVRVAP